MQTPPLTRQAAATTATAATTALTSEAKTQYQK